MKVTAEEYIDILECNELGFDYNGTYYSVCSPRSGEYHIGPVVNGAVEEDVEFATAEEMMDGYLIDGHPLREIIEKAEVY